MDRLLINYLPYVVRDYDVFQGIMAGEQPEFELAWDGATFAIDNQFIDTAGDYGLSRWEKILKINPRSTDTLDSRRFAIKAKLNTIIPYTIRVLIQKITAISNGQPFSVFIERGLYLLELITQWDQLGQLDSLKIILEQMLPVNIALDSQNRILGDCDSTLHVVSGLGFCEFIALSDAGDDYFDLETDLRVPAVPVLCDLVSLDDAGDELIQLGTDATIPAVAVVCNIIPLTDSGDENVQLEVNTAIPTEAVLAETINLHD